MRQVTADLCAAALDLAGDEVVALHDAAELLPALLARLIIEFRQRAQPPCLSNAQRELVDGLRGLYTVGEPFKAGELVELLATPIGDRVRVRAALLDVLRGGVVDAQRVGNALGAIVEVGGAVGGVRLVSPKSERGRRLWCLEAAVG